MPAKLAKNKKGPSVAEREQALSEALFLCISDGVIVTDADGKIERVNKRAIDMLGFKEKELLGAWFPTMIVAEDGHGKPIHTISRPISKAVLSGKPVSARLFYKKRDGSSLPVLTTSSPILFDKKPIGTIDIFQDITEKIKAEGSPQPPV